MDKFEYLSVLISIILGLAIANLLTGATRLIQLRRRIDLHATTLCWMTMLFLANIQVWWVAFERRDIGNWDFFSFLLYLLIPIILFVLSTLVLPDMGDEDDINLQANFDQNRGWFFGLLMGVILVSLLEETVRTGRLPLTLDGGFRAIFLLSSLLAALIGNARYQLFNALFALAMFSLYIAMLFAQLQ